MRMRTISLAMAVALATIGAVSANAQGVPGGDWSPGAGAIGDNTFTGFIDQPSAGASIASGASFQVSGWVVDTTAEGWAGVDDVQVMIGGTTLGRLAVAQNRPDVASALGNPFYTNAGFSGVVSTTMPVGPQTLSVVAHTPGRGSWTKSVAINVTGSGGTTSAASSGTGLVLRIISPTSDDIVPSNNNGTIFGVAYDTRTRAELGSGVDRVTVCLDGPCGQAGSQTLGDANLNGTDWTLTWEPTRFNKVQQHFLWVYAHSNVTGEVAVLQQPITLSR